MDPPANVQTGQHHSTLRKLPGSLSWTTCGRSSRLRL